MIPEFLEFPKMPRLSREMIITEKIDGTNAQVMITEDGEIFCGSRTKWLTLRDDNFGFANWVEANKSEILKLGVGRHFGEWWGSGIQRGYGLPKGEKRFSLFNTTRWAYKGEERLLKTEKTEDGINYIYQEPVPECCHIVPELYKGMFSTTIISTVLNDLVMQGSFAAKGFMKPEGIVAFHVAGNFGFKKTIEKDESPKSKI